MTMRSEQEYALLLSTPRVELLVLPQKASCTVSQGMLVLHSQLFARFLQRSPYWKKEGLVIELENVSVVSVEMFVSWAYQRRLNFPPTVDNDELLRRKEVLIDLYIFADMYCVVALQNDVMNDLADIVGHNPSLITDGDLQYIFGYTRGDCPLRRLALLGLVVNIQDPTLGKKYTSYDPYAKTYDNFMSFVCYWQRRWMEFYHEMELSQSKKPRVKNEVARKSYEPSRLALLLKEEDVAKRFKAKVPSTDRFVRRLLFETPKSEETDVIMIDDDSDE